MAGSTSEWYFRTGGDEVGPVSFGHLQALIGTTGNTGGAFRRGVAGPWISTFSVGHCFAVSSNPPVASAEPVLVAPIPVMDAAPSVVSHFEDDVIAIEDDVVPISDGLPSAEIDEWASLCDALFDAGEVQDTFEDSVPGSNGRALLESPIVPLQEQWICEVLGEELGPMPLDDLKLLARNGELSQDDRVRRPDDAEWIIAHSVEALLAEFPAAAPIAEPEPATDIVRVDAELFVEQSFQDDSEDVAADDTELDSSGTTADETVIADPDTTQRAAEFWKVERTGEFCVLSIQVGRIPLGDPLLRFQKQLAKLATGYDCRELVLDVAPVRSLPSQLLRHLAALRASVPKITLVEAHENLRDDVEFAGLDKKIDVVIRTDDE